MVVRVRQLFQEYLFYLNNMAQLKNEIYDENGLVRVEFIEVDEPTQEELIAQKEAQLLEMFEELKRLKTSI